MNHSSNLLRAVTMTVAFFIPFAAFGQQLKIASVDMEKLFKEYYKTKKAEVELKDRHTAYQKDVNDFRSQLQKMSEDAKKLKEEAENPAYADEKRSEKRKEFEVKVTAMRLKDQEATDFVKNRQQELMEREKSVKNTIVEEISKVVQDKAKRDGYSIVIDRTGQTFNGISPFIFVQDSLDITADVIKTLNAGTPATTTTPTTPGSKDTKDTKAKDTKK